MWTKIALTRRTQCPDHCSQAQHIEVHKCSRHAQLLSPLSYLPRRKSHSWGGAITTSGTYRQCKCTVELWQYFQDPRLFSLRCLQLIGLLVCWCHVFRPCHCCQYQLALRSRMQQSRSATAHAVNHLRFSTRHTAVHLLRPGMQCMTVL